MITNLFQLQFFSSLQYIVNNMKESDVAECQIDMRA